MNNLDKLNCCIFQKALPGNSRCSHSILAQTVFSPVSLSLSPLWARLMAGVSSSSVAMIQQPDSISSLSHRRCSHALSLSSAGSLCCRNTSWELFSSARETGSRSGQCSNGGRVHWWSLNLCLCIAHSWFRVVSLNKLVTESQLLSNTFSIHYCTFLRLSFCFIRVPKNRKHEFWIVTSRG